MATEPARYNPQIQSVLHRLQRESAKDWRILPRLLPAIFNAILRRQSWMTAFTSEAMRSCYIPVAPDLGHLLYLTARQIYARQIVEFGTSFGVSTIYLAAALRDNGGGTLIGSEIIPEKRTRALQNLTDAGLSDLVEIRGGDAMQAFSDLPTPIDLLLLDADKDLYLPMLQMLTPKLRHGAMVFADNIFTFRKSLQPYVDYVQNPQNGFVSMTLPIGDGCQLSCFLPSQADA
ncbi:MAG: class I SAM-dependent methyltransferase [Anaerolineales bacterium]